VESGPVSVLVRLSAHGGWTPAAGPLRGQPRRARRAGQGAFLLEELRQAFRARLIIAVEPADGTRVQRAAESDAVLERVRRFLAKGPRAAGRAEISVPHVTRCSHTRLARQRGAKRSVSAPRRARGWRDG